MARINANGYIERKQGHQNTRLNWRQVFLIISKGADGGGIVGIGNIYFPKEFVGKRIKFKVEEVIE